MELESKKKSRRNKMMRSKSFQTQKLRETGRKEAEECRSFSIVLIGIMEYVFQTEEKNRKDQERLKICRRKFMPERGTCFSMG